MAEIRMRAEWQRLDEHNIAKVGGHMGVYELSTPKGNVTFIGFAGGKSVFGLRGELRDRLANLSGDEVWFRCEINLSYLSRYKELLMVHVADNGAIPIHNVNGDPILGRMSPS